MPCSQWNDDWIAHLYDELDVAETLALKSHLEQCASCSEELERLAECRDWIGKNAPTVPASPRVIVLQPRGARSGWFGFASGLAAAVVIFAVGLVAAPRLQPVPQQTERAGVEAASRDDLATLDVIEAALARHTASVDSRLEAYAAQLNQTTQTSRPTPQAEQAWVSRQRLEDEFQAMQAAWNRQRALDMQTVFRELALTEEATNSRLQDHMLAIRLRADPRISEK